MKSPRFGTPGSLAFSTAQANGSTSETNAQLQPRGRHATVAASIPLHTLPYRISDNSFPKAATSPDASRRSTGTVNQHPAFETRSGTPCHALH